MRRTSFWLLAVLVCPVVAQLPYNPSRILSIDNGSLAYVFNPTSSASQFSLSLLNTSDVVAASSPPSSILYPQLPFLSTGSPRAFMPLIDNDGNMTVLTGNCSQDAQGLQMWKFSLNSNKKNGTWTQSEIALSDPSLGTEFLSAGFSFTPTTATGDNDLYVFGGMCPNTSTASMSDWTSQASYSNTVLTIAAGSTAATTGPSQVSMTGDRAPPIPEAGLTITPLLTTYSSTSAGNTSLQQNFVLLGGHTQTAFINMSQVALFSLPEGSWAFLGVDQSSNLVEPRSGHTAVMTEDGSRIIVFGGWVGDITQAATPQLAVLEIGQGYGGTGDWAWTVPKQVANPLGASQGIYGHGAAMLSGDVMMITGGYSIASSGSKAKRQSQTTSSKTWLFNTTSSTWISSYTNPSSPLSPAYTGSAKNSAGALATPSQKAGLGAGLGLGLAALMGLVLVWLWYSRKLRQRRTQRERELRELALGAERYHSDTIVGGGVDGRGGHPVMGTRSASWANRQEKHIGFSDDDNYPWAPVISPEQAGKIGVEAEDHGMREAERTGLMLDVPSPTRGLRRSLHSRGPLGYGQNFGPVPGGVPHQVFRIDEEEEGSNHGGSLKRSKAAGQVPANRQSDPFKDPPPAIVASTSTDPAAEERKREVEGWVEDWSAAAQTMSRNPSQATNQGRTYSNLSAAYAASHSGSGSGSSPTGRGSPDKSDRTGSNLSEQSVFSNSSIQRSINGASVSRNVSQRSTSAGYAIFAAAAAAMAAKVGVGVGSGSSSSRNGNGNGNANAQYGTVTTGKGDIQRAPSKRSTSLNFNSTSSSQNQARHKRERSETFSTARTSLGPILPGEDQALLSQMNSRAVADDRDREREYWETPPESPTKARDPRANSLTNSIGRRAYGMLGSVRRVFSGTGHVDVRDRVNTFEQRSGQSSPTKHSTQPPMAEVPRRTASAGAAFWRGKRGAKDWDAPELPPSTISTLNNTSNPPEGSVIKRRPLADAALYGELDEDWDPETAVQNRVVQVMFTVPKEKLRVVNVDALSLLSKSDVDFEGGENDGTGEVERMTSVREMGEEEEKDDQIDHDGHGGGGGGGKGKGKEVVRVTEENGHHTPLPVPVPVPVPSMPGPVSAAFASS